MTHPEPTIDDLLRTLRPKGECGPCDETRKGLLRLKELEQLRVPKGDTRHALPASTAVTTTLSFTVRSPA